MNINIVLSDKHKKEENILKLYYDKFEIENIMNQNIQKQHYFIYDYDIIFYSFDG
jgi:hypothetical protein